jgi:UDP-N-acetylglucosamine:LPS N-acetylglucosamine transferase
MGKYLFLYLKTGGGHLAPAKAVAEEIRSRRKSDPEILLVDGLSESTRQPGHMNFFMPYIKLSSYQDLLRQLFLTS